MLQSFLKSNCFETFSEIEKIQMNVNKLIVIREIMKSAKFFGNHANLGFYDILYDSYNQRISPPPLMNLILCRQDPPPSFVKSN